MSIGTAKIRVTADLGNVKKDLNSINTELRAMKKNSEKANSALKQIGKSNNMGKLEKTVKSTNKELSKMQGYLKSIAGMTIDDKFAVLREGAEASNVETKDLKDNLGDVKKTHIKSVTKELEKGLQQSQEASKQTEQAIKGIDNVVLHDKTEELRKGFNQLEGDLDKTQADLNKISNSRVDFDTAPAEADLNNLVDKTQMVARAFIGLNEQQLKDVAGAMRLGLEAAQEDVRLLGHVLNTVGNDELPTVTDVMRRGFQDLGTTVSLVKEQIQSMEKVTLKDVTVEARKGMDKLDADAKESEATLKNLNKIELEDPTDSNMRPGLEKTERAADKLFDKLRKINGYMLKDNSGGLRNGLNKTTGAITAMSTAAMATQEIMGDMIGVTGKMMESYGELSGVVRETTYQFSGADDMTQANAMSIEDLTQKMNSNTAEGRALNDMWGKLQTAAGLTAFSVKDTADGMLELSKAGISAEDATDMLVPTMIAADMNGQDLGKTMHDVAGIVASFGYDLKDTEDPGRTFTEMLNKMQVAADVTQSDLSDLTEGLKYMAPTATTVGWEVDDAVVSIAALGDVGLEASKGARVLTTGLQRLAAPTEKAAATMEEYGIEIYDANGNMKGFIPIVEEFKKATIGLTDEQKSQMMVTIFGANSLKAWSSVMNISTDSLKKNTEAVESANDGFGYLTQKFAEVKLGVPTAELEEMDKHLRSIDDDTERAAQKQEYMNQVMADFVEENPAQYLDMVSEKMQSFGVAIGGVVDHDLAKFIFNMKGPAKEALEGFQEGLTGSTENTKGFTTEVIASSLEVGIFAGALTIAIAGLGALGAAFVVTEVVLTFRDALAELGYTSQDVGLAFGEFIDGTLAVLNYALSEILQPVLETFIETWVKLGDTLAPLWQEAFPAIDTAITDSLVPAFQSLIEEIGGLAEDVIPLLLNVLPEVIDDFAGVVEGVAGIIGAIDDFVEKYPNMVQGFIRIGISIYLVRKIFSLFSGFTKVFSVFGSGFSSMVELIGNDTKKMAKHQADAGKSMGKSLSTFGKTTLKGVGIFEAGLAGIFVASAGAMAYGMATHKDAYEQAGVVQDQYTAGLMESTEKQLGAVTNVSQLTQEQLQQQTDAWAKNKDDVQIIIDLMNGQTPHMADGTEAGVRRTDKALDRLAQHWNITRVATEVEIQAMNATGGTIDVGIAQGVGSYNNFLDTLTYNHQKTSADVEAYIGRIKSDGLTVSEGIAQGSNESKGILDALSKAYGMTEADIVTTVMLLNGQTPKMADGTKEGTELTKQYLDRMANEFDTTPARVAISIAAINAATEKQSEGSKKGHLEIKKSQDEIDHDVAKTAKNVSKTLGIDEKRWNKWARQIEKENEQAGRSSNKGKDRINQALNGTAGTFTDSEGNVGQWSSVVDQSFDSAASSASKNASSIELSASNIMKAVQQSNNAVNNMKPPPKGNSFIVDPYGGYQSQRSGAYSNTTNTYNQQQTTTNNYNIYGQPSTQNRTLNRIMSRGV